ncbi:MAG TPA: heavy metal-responsive transcriptional regulator [Elusimicrobiota bacterium]|nr:heavy metal-responsive transcriptional regulator [Elusimicrobiota bacterium]
MSERYLQIGAIAKRARVNIQTIRYYERRGLVSPEGHRESGYRLYSGEAIKKIRFIKNAQDLGFTLEEIMSLLKLQVSRKSKCGQVKRKAEEKIADVRSKINSLKAIERALLGLVKSCRSRSETDPCPILKSLELDKEAPTSSSYCNT